MVQREQKIEFHKGEGVIPVGLIPPVFEEYRKKREKRILRKRKGY